VAAAIRLNKLEVIAGREDNIQYIHTDSNNTDSLFRITPAEGTANFILSVKDRAQDKIGILTELLRPLKVENIF
jgi:hypothetical protein